MAERFVRGNDRLAGLLSDPGTTGRVKAIRVEMDQADRVHAMGLAAIRQAAGIKQAAVSGLESRGDVLLSTLASYLTAAGATDITLSAVLGDRRIEVALPDSSGKQSSGKE